MTPLIKQCNAEHFNRSWDRETFGPKTQIWWLNLFVGDWSGRGRKELTVGTMLWMLWSTLAKTHASGHVSSCCASIFQFCRRASAFYATRCFSADQGRSLRVC